MTLVSKRMFWALVGLAALCGCGEGEDGQQSDPSTQRLDQSSAACFSPDHRPELALDQPEAGCSCAGDAAQCVSTTYQGRPWDVALVCSAGRWTSVEDGPCEPRRL